jgi:hypothetical protein
MPEQAAVRPEIGPERLADGEKFRFRARIGNVAKAQRQADFARFSRA